MPRKNTSDFDQRLLDLYDGYAHDRLSRREFLDKATRFAVGGVTATMLLQSLSPQYALASQVDENDPRIRSEYVGYESPNGHGTIRGYLTRPADAEHGELAAVLVVHENRGLNPYIEDVARRLAVAGYMGLAPDGLTPLGGYPGNDEEGKAMQRQLESAKLLEDFIAAFEYLNARPDATGKVGVVGFCFGGTIANAMAVRVPDLAAAVPFYGRQAASQDVAQIQAPLLLHYAGLDERVNEGWPEYERALKANDKTYTAHFYADVNHGFHNDNTPRYDDAAAELAWQRTLEFFEANLS